MIPNCDKNVPGLLMAAARLNLPTTFVSGGPMFAGHIDGHKTSLQALPHVNNNAKLFEKLLHIIECFHSFHFSRF